ncbi:hypothetical protein D9Q98_000756 [Chlorella vulgaris]|uniref:non-specific serine/threonine protein kinase n=1 Tax=Chlorella vulgaris TaxID=3077 RepID=A0A9D4Z285_CHLVU|nr:hypothetical protein D9Q98_000756 [Chlorella vulgaris]
MGNQLTQPRLDAAEAVAELGGSVTFKDSLGGGRFFKSSLCVHDDGGLVVVKVYAKRDDTPDLRPYRERLLGVRSALSGLDYPHTWAVQRVYESERAAFLVRQYLHANLAQRITTRPFLTLIEKRWVAYQLLLALAQCHERGVCHGDIKAENVALSSWDWAFLVDFAPHKPTLLPADNPADFSFFFDTSGRRKCCLAPERFYDPAPGGITPQQAADAPLTPAMDVFSLGCLLAELFLDGQPLFDYSCLLAYRQGGAAAAASLAGLDKVHPSVRGMVAHMVQRDPGQRHSVQQYLQEVSSTVLPPWLASTIHPFFASMLHLDTDARVALASREYPLVKAQLLAGAGANSGSGSTAAGAAAAGAAAAGAAAGGAAAGGAAAKGTAAVAQGPLQQHEPAAAGEAAGGGTARLPLEQAVAGLHSEAQASLKRLEGRGSRGSMPQQTPRGSDSGAGPDQQQRPEVAGEERAAVGAPAASDAPDTQQAGARGVAVAGSAPHMRDAAAQPHDGMVLVAVLLCTLLRGSRLQEHKARCVWLLRDAAAHCDDETRLQRVLPFLVAATAEPLAAVKAVALRAVARVLAQVSGVPPSEAKVFTEYVLPSLSLLPSEAEVMVQVEYAACITQLACTAQAFLEQLQRRRLQRAASSPAGAATAPLLNYDEEVGVLRAGVEAVVHGLLVGPHPETKLALLPHLGPLAAFVGRRDTADLLLPSLLTFFNSQSWQVRAAFYSSFACVCPSLGPEGVAAILLPFLDRLLGDPQPAVAAEALCLLAALADRGLLRKRHLLALAARLCSRQMLGPGVPPPLRAAAVQCLAATARQLPPADVYAQLLPLVLPHLSCEPLDMGDPQQLALVLRTDSQGGSDGGSQRAAWAGRPPTMPPRPGLPPRQGGGAGEGGAAGNVRRSLDSLAAPGGGRVATGGGAGAAATAAGMTSSIMAGGGGGGGGAGSRSMLLPPPSASTYSLRVAPRFLLHSSSYLSAALEQSVMAGAAAGGHLVASSGGSGSGGGNTPGRLSLSAQWGPADSGQQLVARARRSLPQPAGMVQQLRVPPLAAPPRAPPGPPLQHNAPLGVRDAMSAALAAGMPGGGGSSGGGGHQAPWYPRGVLVAHLSEHRQAVSRLALSGCGSFFASASADETVKVWDCRRLDRDVSFRSRLTYSAQSGRITCLAACQDSQSMASGSAAGSIHVWRVEYAARAGGTPDRYTGIVGCRQVAPPGCGSVLDLSPCGASLLLHSSQQGGVAAWDLRTGRDAWALPCPPAAGTVQRFLLDPSSHNWLLGGSSRGQLSLWDLRFRLPVSSWQHPAGTPITALAAATAPPQRLGLGGAAGPLVYVAAGEAEVGVWDIGDAKCKQASGGAGKDCAVLRVLRPGSGEAARHAVPAALSPPAASLLPQRGADMMSRARQLAISELQAPQSRREGCRALLPTPGGQLLAGGSDRAVRCWDSGRPQQSYVVCAPPPPIPTTQTTAQAAVDAAADAAAEGSQVTMVDVPQYSYAYRSVQGVPVVEESCTLQRSSCNAATSGPDREQHQARMAWTERAAALCHQLAVTDLLRVEATEPLLLSAGADGVIKAWR